MSEIGSIGGGASASGAPRPRQADHGERPGQQAEPRAARRGEDRVEVSALAQSMSRLNADPPVRQDLIDRVRAEIEAGVYETPERLDRAIDGLIREIDPTV